MASESDYREYLSLLWADIHHGRNQDWQVLLIIFTITVAAVPVPSTETLLKAVLVVLALAAAAIGMATSIQHWTIYADKMELVRFCEEELGLRVLHKAVPRNFMKVSRWISSLFGFVAAGYVVILYYMIAPSPQWYVAAGLIVLIVAVSLATTGLWQRKIDLRGERTNHTLTRLRAPFRGLPPNPDFKADADSGTVFRASLKRPKLIYSHGKMQLEAVGGKPHILPGGGLVVLPALSKTRVTAAKPVLAIEIDSKGLCSNDKSAELGVLQSQLATRGKEPLKLVVGELRNGEATWKANGYAGTSQGMREVLVDESDRFEVSFANDGTSQDFHRHVNLWETYVSLSEITVQYLRFGQPLDACETKTSLAAVDGFHVITVPPGICHQVKLGGFSLVIQQAFSAARIQDDKRRCASCTQP